jgi:hypothetical protein
MRHPRVGMGMACLATLVICFLSPASAVADFIRAGATGQAESTQDVSDAIPLPSPDPQVPFVPDRVGYAVTAEEFLGGVIMLSLCVGGAIYIGLLAGRDEL